MQTTVRQHPRRTRFGIQTVKTHDRNYNLKSITDYERTSLDVCPKCEVRMGKVQAYPSQEGWKISGYTGRQWLYRRCPRCNWECPLTYLGVKRC